MYDKYDNPSSGDDGIYEKTPMDQAKEIGGAASSILKQYGKFIIIGIIALLVLFFVYDFFIGSYQNVSFNVKDTEGKSISATIAIYGADNKQIKSIQSGTSISLKNGPYKIDVAATDYKTITGNPVTVSPESTVIPIKMQADMDIELSGSFPENLFTGEKKEITLTITNNDNAPKEIALVLDDDAKNTMSIEYGSPLYATIGSREIIVTLNVDRDPKSSEIGDAKTGTIRIEGLDTSKAKISGKYNLQKLDLKDIKVEFNGSENKAEFKTVKTGTTSEKSITVENKTDTPIADMIIELNITSTEFTDAEEVKSWFSFEKKLAIVESGQKETVSVELRVPDSTKFGPGKNKEIINGEFVVSSSTFSKKFNLNLTIEKAESKINISGIRDSYTIRKDGNTYPKQSGFIEIKNSGEVLLINFELRVVCDYPGVEWLKLGSGINTFKFDELNADETKNVPFTIDVPNSTRAGEISRCNIRTEYIEPTSIEPISVEKAIIITTQ
ncbi:MAG: carboxypeptidase-like regulatory domain-containing protein [archaeon]|nr:carboxypeptidase-like regulatory domain-containing protein [archaeon]